jgi:2-polyprenyl-6-methoxyphenol hydroxylase-like FAD-dependent oxidoreductase
VLLVGDAAGLAYPQSGEGIRPAVESGLLAASTIIAAGRTYSLDRLLDYERRLWARLPAGGESGSAPPADRSAAAPAPWAPIAARLSQRVATSLLRMPWFVHQVVLDRWFLRAADPALVSSPVEVDVA